VSPPSKPGSSSPKDDSTYEMDLGGTPVVAPVIVKAMTIAGIRWRVMFPLRVRELA
jgi:hypothetical protein